MVAEVRTYAATVPAGSSIGSPAKIALSLPVRIVRRVEMLFPPGPNGNVGVSLAAAGQPVVPYGAGQWIVANGETVGFDIDGQIESGSWALWGYNTGTLDHTIQVRLFLDLPRLADAGGVLPLSGLALTGVTQI